MEITLDECLSRQAVQGLGVANYAGMDTVYLAGDWCSGRLFATGWDAAAKKWQMQELMQTSLQFTAGNVDEDGFVLATGRNIAGPPPRPLPRIELEIVDGDVYAIGVTERTV